MNTRTLGAVGAVAAALAVVVATISYLQSFDAEKISCDAIGEARAQLEAMYESGVDASVQIHTEERAQADERLSQCLRAKPKDPCADAQSARDAAVAEFNGIASPPEGAPYAEFKTYFKKREDAYNKYKQAKDALDQCRAENPPKTDVPYEQSDVKACLDAFEVSLVAMRERFERDTGIMRSALRAAHAALDAREKACNPPKGGDKFTDPPGGESDGASDGVAPTDLMSCRMLNPDVDIELLILRARAAAIPGEIEGVQTSIDNVRKRISALRGDLREVDTYIPPEATRTQFEGALNALRAERKVAIESTLDFFESLLTRKQAEKSELEKELSDVQSQIAKRLAEIEKENQARRAKYPTNLHLAKPDKCAYYHCHGMLCGRPDPVQDGCGHGSTTQDDVDCKMFFDAYLKAGGVN